MSQGLCPSCEVAANLNTIRIFIFCLLVGIVAGCEKPSSKLAVLDGVTYVGDAQPRMVMGVSMFGRYKLQFLKGENGKMKCSLTVTVHDAMAGWNEPKVTEISDLIFENGADDRILIHRNLEISAPGIIKSGQIPDSLTMFNENFDEIHLTRTSTVEEANGNSEQVRVKIAPTVLMSRERFEEIFGKPSETSEQFDTNYAGIFGYSLWDLIGMMSAERFALPEENKERVHKPFEEASYKKTYASFPDEQNGFPNVIPQLVSDLSRYGVEPFSPGDWEKDRIYQSWFLSRNQGITGISFAEYLTSDSKLRAFYVEDRLFVLVEYRPKKVPSSDWSGWSNRFLQIEGSEPLLVRTNIGLPTNPKPPPQDPLNLCSSDLVYENYPIANVSFLGTNYFGQLVSDSPSYSATHATELIIGDASFLYPLTIEDTEKEWRFTKKVAAKNQADTEAILRQADRENARAAVMEELQRRAGQ
jgi:hypothetical protein